MVFKPTWPVRTDSNSYFSLFYHLDGKLLPLILDEYFKKQRPACQLQQRFHHSSVAFWKPQGFTFCRLFFPPVPSLLHSVFWAVLPFVLLVPADSSAANKGRPCVKLSIQTKRPIMQSSETSAAFANPTLSVRTRSKWRPVAVEG